MEKINLLIYFLLIFNYYLVVNAALEKVLPDTCKTDIECTFTSKPGDVLTFEELKNFKDLKMLRDLRPNSTLIDSLLEDEKGIADATIKHIYINGLVYIFMNTKVFKIPEELYYSKVEPETPFNKTYGSLQECFEAYCKMAQKNGVLKCTKQTTPKNWVFNIDIDINITKETNLCAQTVKHVIIGNVTINYKNQGNIGFRYLLNLDIHDLDISSLDRITISSRFHNTGTIAINNNPNHENITFLLFRGKVGYEIRTTNYFYWREIAKLRIYNRITRCIKYISNNRIQSNEICYPKINTSTTLPFFHQKTTTESTQNTNISTPTTEVQKTKKDSNRQFSSTSIEKTKETTQSGNSILNNGVTLTTNSSLLFKPMIVTNSDTMSTTDNENYSTLTNDPFTITNSILEEDATTLTTVISNKVEPTIETITNSPLLIKIPIESTSFLSNEQDTPTQITLETTSITPEPTKTLKIETWPYLEKKSSVGNITSNTEAILDVRTTTEAKTQSLLTQPMIFNNSTTIIEALPIPSGLRSDDYDENEKIIQPEINVFNKTVEPKNTTSLNMNKMTSTKITLETTSITPEPTNTLKIETWPYLEKRSSVGNITSKTEAILDVKTTTEAKPKSSLTQPMIFNISTTIIEAFPIPSGLRSDDYDENEKIIQPDIIAFNKTVEPKNTTSLNMNKMTPTKITLETTSITPEPTNTLKIETWPYSEKKSSVGNITSKREAILDVKTTTEAKTQSLLTQPMIFNNSTTIIEALPIPSELRSDYYDENEKIIQPEINVFNKTVEPKNTTSLNMNKMTPTNDAKTTPTSRANTTPTSRANTTPTSSAKPTPASRAKTTPASRAKTTPPIPITTPSPNNSLDQLDQKIKALHTAPEQEINNKDNKLTTAKNSAQFQALVKDGDDHDHDEEEENENDDIMSSANGTIEVFNNNSEIDLSSALFPKTNPEYQTEDSNHKITVVFYIAIAIFIILFTAFMIYYFYEIH